MKIINKYLPHITLVLFAFLLYGNTLTYDYTLDDLMVIKQNSFTTKGLKGIPDIFSYDSFTGFFGKEKKLVSGGRYRPLSIATFAIEYQFTGNLNPSLSHFINILLYGLTGILIFLLLKKLIPGNKGSPWFFSLPFMVAFLFLAHPVHTEVVANIKGRDEILALLFSLYSAWFAILFVETRKITYLVACAGMLFLGLMSKENAIAFVLITPLIIAYFYKEPLPGLLRIAGTLSVVALLFVFIRFLVLGYLNSGDLPRELLNNPFIDANVSQKIGTILLTLGLYIKLLLFPFTLTHDYYPYHIPLTEFSALPSILSGVIYIILVFLAFWLRKEKVIAISIWIYLVPLFIVSNIIFPVGTFMNERFIYFSSLGFILAAIYIIWYKIPEFLPRKIYYHKLVLIFLFFVVLTFTGRTITRNVVWKDNFTLFTSDVKTSVNSVKCNIAAGGEWMKEAESQKDSSLIREYFDRSVGYLEKAIEIYPNATNGLVLYGNALAKYKKDFKASIRQYLKVLEFDPYEPNAFKNTLIVLNSLPDQSDFSYKITVYKKLLAVYPDNPEVNARLGKIYGQFKSNIDSAQFFLERAYNSSPGDPAICKDLGIVYGIKGNYSKAISFLSKAGQLNPNDPTISQNIAITRQMMAKTKSKN
jgi:tetratricopeptide (TPR) repeat protein